MKTLETKVAGLPAWAWVLLAVAGVYGVSRWEASRKAAASTSASAVTQPLVSTQGTNLNADGTTTVNTSQGMVVLPPLPTVHPIPVSSISALADPVAM